MTEDQKAYLTGLANKQGEITASKVVEDARHKDSPLHDLFEWDVKKAAMQYWLDRARQLIRCLEISIVTHEPERVRVVPMFVRDPRQPSDKQGYLAANRIRDDKELARATMLHECKQVMAVLQRAMAVADALEATEQLGDIVHRVRRFRDDIERRFPGA